MALVLAVTVFIDLIAAVGIGVFLAALGYVHTIAQDQLAALGEERLTDLDDEERRLYDGAGGRIRIFEFNGPLSFGAAADLAHQVRVTLGGQEVLILDFAQMPSLDVSAAYAIRSIIEDAVGAKRHVYMCNMTDAVRAKVDGLGLVNLVKPENILPTRKQALQRASDRLGGHGGSATAAAEGSPQPA
jgi:SulP family sulfate permease